MTVVHLSSSIGPVHGVCVLVKHLQAVTASPVVTMFMDLMSILVNVASLNKQTILTIHVLKC